VVIAEDDKVISGSSDKTIKIWDCSAGQSRDIFGNYSVILSLVLSHDSRWLVCGDDNGRIWIFEWVK
jgi:WD40 repeat protein